MLNLGWSFLSVVGAYKIYTESVTWNPPLPNHHLFYLTLYIDLSVLLTSLSDSAIFIYYESYQVCTVIVHASPCLDTVQEGKKHACFTKLAPFLAYFGSYCGILFFLYITSWIGSGLYRLNQLDISALIFGGYARFIPLDKIVCYVLQTRIVFPNYEVAEVIQLGFKHRKVD